MALRWRDFFLSDFFVEGRNFWDKIFSCLISFKGKAPTDSSSGSCFFFDKGDPLVLVEVFFNVF